MLATVHIMWHRHVVEALVDEFQQLSMEMTTDNMRAILQKLDKDRDGQLSRKELRHGFEKKFRIKLSAAQVSAIFGEFGVGDGDEIDFDHFVNVLEEFGLTMLATVHIIVD